MQDKSLDAAIADANRRCEKNIENTGCNNYSNAFKEAIIRQVDGSMAIEGMPLTKEDKERIWNFAFDPVLAKEAIRGLVEKHTVTRG